MKAAAAAPGPILDLTRTGTAQDGKLVSNGTTVNFKRLRSGGYNEWVDDVGLIEGFNGAINCE